MKIGKVFSKVSVISGCILVLLVLTYALIVTNSRSKRIITEYTFTPFGYPHPYYLKQVAQYRFVQQVGEFLIRRGDNAEIIPGLAQSWEIDSSRKKITFHLRPHLYSAREVSQSLVRLIKFGQTSHSNLAEQIAENGIAVIDDITLQIETTGDAAAILPPLVMPDATILPDHCWVKDSHGNEQVDWAKTKGPYIYSSGQFPLTESHALIFKPNKNHYFYDSKQLDWQIEYHPLSSLEHLSQLKHLLESKPSFTTLRYWEAWKIFGKTENDLLYYQTKPNGISFIVPNLKSKVYKNKEARLKLAKTVLNTSIPLLLPNNKANQIAQPGMTGRIDQQEINDYFNKIEHNVSKQEVTLAVPNNPELNFDWYKQVASVLSPTIKVVRGGSSILADDWLNGQYDLFITSIGMSDTDPISSASFLFSPNGARIDIDNGKIMKILNAAKHSQNPEVITNAVRSAFRLALFEGLIIPLSYTVNRHYYSKDVQLNITDPFAEAVKIWEVRIN